MATVRTVGVAGTGLIGAGWAARLLIRGFDVIAYDVAAAAEPKLRAAVDVAWPSMSRLLQSPARKRGRLSFTTDLEEMATKVDFIHEAAPEREDLKIKLFRDLDSLSRPDVVLASSSSGFLPSRLQSECRHPERVLIGHPFNPVYLLPLVELVPGAKTGAAAMELAADYFESIGMHVLRLKKEIEGYICDRLQEALWREALHVLDKGIGTTGDIDDSLTYSAGMRWAFMGSFLTYHLAGGPGGMRAFIKQFDPTLELPWTDLKFPKWNAELERRLIEGCEAQAGGLSVAEIEAKRNDILVDMMRLFRQHRIGAGNVLAREEERIYGERAFKRWKKGAKVASPLKLHRGEVQPGWVDYNGHMSDAFYLWAFGEATDALFRYVGDDEDYRAAGLTFFTAETHVNYFREMRSGEPMRFETQLVGLDPKRMHVFHRMIHGRTGDLVATNEIMLLHVDTKTRRTAPMRADVHPALEAVWKEHKKLSKPRELGRTMKVGGAKKLSQSRQRGRRR